jgi:predicted DNA-binding transcriptional regulator AlpA
MVETANSAAIRRARCPSPPLHQHKLVKAFGDLPDHSYVKTRVLQGLLGCSRATVWRRCAAGQLPKPLRKDGHILGWRVADIREYLDAASK